MSFQATTTYVAMSCLATYYFARFYWARAMQRLKAFVATWFPGHPTIRGVWTVKQALLFREGQESDDKETDEISTDFLALPRSLIDFDRPDLLDFVDSIAPNDWESWKLELRCENNKAGKSRKKRIVVRRGETLGDIQDECEASSGTIIIGAFFLSDRTDTSFTTKRLDITHRIKKYVLSPDRELLCRDLFPMDDPESWFDDFDDNDGDDDNDGEKEIQPHRLPGILVHGWSPSSGDPPKSGFTFTEVLRMDQSLRDVLHF